MTQQKYPVAERFTSPQGEGQFAGTMMHFIRLAGCTVGKPYKGQIVTRVYEDGSSSRHTMTKDGELPIYTEQCTLYDGRTFACDTDYRVKERLTPNEIVADIPENIEHICISGGEPFMHNLDPLIQTVLRWLAGRGLPHSRERIHIETSGTTVMPTDHTCLDAVWVTVSPKSGVRPEWVTRANELKILIDKDFDIEKLPLSIVGHPLIYLSPVNGEHTIDGDNLRIAMKLQEKYPKFRITMQLHKVVEHFIGEHVR